MRDGVIHYKLYLLKLIMAVDNIVFRMIKGSDPIKFNKFKKTFLFMKLGSLLSARCRHRSMKSSRMEGHTSLSTVLVEQ